ncbi:MAG: DEAD/DEAH box helicase family protein, partial [Candidatus Methanofastidiosa archaeon]|nr:DEAD/DEAH box helicase family protein [Candidatus Methanofastidiosa archaeon]
MDPLYKIFENSIVRNILTKVDIPNFIVENLVYTLRPYQIEAFKRYIFTDREDFEEKPSRPFHLLYNMATGSGKTLIMAGLILYLFEKGYHNFVFFVNSNNIIQKTKDNFLNPRASKYLFKDKIVVDGKEVFIKEL